LTRHQARIGIAGWSIPREYADRFPAEGSHLERYSQRFSAVEINSSFYRPHRQSTYLRWSSETPEGFAFSLKIPKEITHTRRLVDAEEPLVQFLDESSGLGAKRGPILIQLPPSLRFEVRKVNAFLTLLRDRYNGLAACEPRHPTWFTPEVDRLLGDYEIARVAADPAVVPAASEPGGWSGLVYQRLHGSPKMYYSAYSDESLDHLADTLANVPRTVQTWCIFDNTAEGAAIEDAFRLLERIGAKKG
jgi:uncharacterized protein YecE (DUF72 family)